MNNHGVSAKHDPHIRISRLQNQLLKQGKKKKKKKKLCLL